MSAGPRDHWRLSSETDVGPTGPGGQADDAGESQGRVWMETRGQGWWGSWRGAVVPPGFWGRSVGRASAPRTQSKLCPCHVLDRPRLGALRPDQDRWRGPPLERLLPKEQARPLVWGPPPEQHYLMSPEHGKFGRGGQWEERFPLKKFWAMVPFLCRHPTTISEAPATPHQHPRAKHLLAISFKEVPIPRGPKMG